MRERHRVMVTGGTGFIGRALVRMLTYSPEVEEIRLITRDAQRARFIEKYCHNIRIFEGDMRDTALIEACATGVTLVFHSAGLKPDILDVAGEREFMEINKDAALAIAETVARHGARRFVYFSSTGVYGKVSGPRLDEDSSCLPLHPYERSKLSAEIALEELACCSAMEIVILRPSNVFGEEHPQRHLLTFMRAINRRLFVLTRPSGWANFVHVDDVASGAVWIGLWREPLPSPVRYVLNCPIPMVGLACEVARILSVPETFPLLPLWLMRPAAWACDRLAIIGGVRLPLTSAKIEEMANPNYFDSGRLKDLWKGWPTTGLAEGLRKTAESYRQRGWL